jgi:phage tail-like protein
MARSQSFSEDPLMTYKFALRELPSPATALDSKVLPQSEGRSPDYYRGLVGFQTLTMPEVSVEMRDVIEGNWPHPRRVPLTRMTTGDVTLAQAVFPNSSDFYVWIFQCLYGRGAPKRSFGIDHLARSRGSVNAWEARRSIRLINCLPVSWKPGSDFDATAAEVSLEELTMNVERIDLELFAGAPSQT